MILNAYYFVCGFLGRRCLGGQFDRIALVSYCGQTVRGRPIMLPFARIQIEMSINISLGNIFGPHIPNLTRKRRSNWVVLWPNGGKSSKTFVLRGIAKSLVLLVLISTNSLPSGAHRSYNCIKTAGGFGLFSTWKSCPVYWRP